MMRIRRWLSPAVRSVGLWVILYSALQIAIASIHRVNPLLLSLIATFPFMYLWLKMVSSVSKLHMPTLHAGLGFLVLAIGFFAASIFHFEFSKELLLIFTAAFLGYTLSALIREPGILLPVALIAGLVDIWGVYYGTTLLLLKQHPHVVNAVTAAVPSGASVEPLVRIGFGDFVFLGLFLTSIHRFHMNSKRTLILLYVLLTCSLVAVLLVGFNIPALAPMAIAVVVANIRQFKLTRQEWFALLYVAIALVVGIAIYLLTR